MNKQMIRSPLCALLGITHPIILAPMAGVAGGRLAAAVSQAGGLGLIGGGYCDEAWLEREFEHADGVPVGVGFIGWRLAQAHGLLARVLERRPRAVLLSFGGTAAESRQILDSGARLLVQVQSVGQAREAQASGADVVIAQGAEAGGHAGMRGTLPLVAAVVDAVAPLPVVAAGGIADGRGLVAAMALGAAGAMLGSRFYASTEALAAAGLQDRAVSASGDDTVRSAVFDRLRGWDWPPGYGLRTLRNQTTQRFENDPAGFESGIDEERKKFGRAVRDADPDNAAVIVGEAADLLRAVQPAADIVRAVIDEASAVLTALSAARLIPS